MRIGAKSPNPAKSRRTSTQTRKTRQSRDRHRRKIRPPGATAAHMRAKSGNPAKSRRTSTQNRKSGKSREHRRKVGTCGRNGGGLNAKSAHPETSKIGKCGKNATTSDAKSGNAAKARETSTQNRTIRLKCGRHHQRKIRPSGENAMRADANREIRENRDSLRRKIEEPGKIARSVDVKSGHRRQIGPSRKTRET